MIKQIVFYCQYCFSSLFSGLCGKLGSKILSLILVVAIIFCCTIPTYAADLDGTDSFYAIDMDYGMSYLNTSGEWIDCTTDLTVKGVTTFNGENCAYWRASVADYDDISGRIRILGLSEDIKLNADHTYTLEFKYGAGYCTNTGFACWLYFYDSQGNVLKTQELCDVSAISTKNSSLISFSQDFKPDASDLSSYTCKLVFAFSNVTKDDNTNYLSEVIYLNDNDDNTSWFQKIINKINDVWQSVKELPEKIGVYIQQIATDITEGLKSLFVPDEGFFDEKMAELKSFLEEHFGILYTAPNILFTILKRLLTISPEEPSLTMPAIQFMWQGEKITLTEPITIYFNDYIANGGVLETFYSFYRAFASVTLILMFINYAKNKYDYLFGKDGEAVE